jgi:hypothetical protein
VSVAPPLATSVGLMGTSAVSISAERALVIFLFFWLVLNRHVSAREMSCHGVNDELVL